MEQILKQNPRWGSRDRRFIAETTYEMVRWWRYISESFCPSESRKGKVEDGIGTADYYKLFATWQILKGLDLPEWEEFADIDKNQIIKNAEQVKLIRKYRESIPDWLDELGAQDLGEAVWENELHELNTEAQVVLRVNTLKTSSEELKNKLLTQGIGLETLNSTSP